LALLQSSQAFILDIPRHLSKKYKFFMVYFSMYK